METQKTCTKCNQTKPISYFPSDINSIDRHTEYCHSCVVDGFRITKNEEKTKYRRSKHGVIISLKMKLKKANNKQELCFSLNDFTNWLDGNQFFNYYYEKWVQFSYDRDHTVRIIKKDNSKGYTLDNLEIATLHSIRHKRSLTLKPVNKYYNNGRIEEFSSIDEAARLTGLSKNSIMRVLRNKQKLAGNCFWAYKD